MDFPKILVTDDGSPFTRLLKSTFENEGWEVLIINHGEDCIESALNIKPDLIIIDILVPGIDGIDICRRLRQAKYESPIIILSGLNVVSQKVKLLNLGADDYIIKPFAIEELTARVKANLRRAKIFIGSQNHRFDSKYISINFDKRQVKCRGAKISLSPIEYKLLQELVQNIDKTSSYEYLLNKVWGKGYGLEKHFLHVYINRLRKKLELDPKNPQLLISIPCEGYLLSLDET